MSKPTVPPRRRSPWLRSQSEGFRPIKQVGVAFAVGMPLMTIGVILLAMAISTGGDSSLLWWLGGGCLAGGLLAGASGSII